METIHPYQEEIDEIREAKYYRIYEIERDIKHDVSIYMKRSLMPGSDKVKLRLLLIAANEVLHIISDYRKRFNHHKRHT